nr:MAG TPA: hypothetical protein [Caudoviricetes sp.]
MPKSQPCCSPRAAPLNNYRRLFFGRPRRQKSMTPRFFH